MMHDPQYPARLYDRYRPSFPDALFRLVAEHAPSRNRVLDCATGTGKTARSLKAEFKRIIAFDRDISMLRSGMPESRICFLRTKAERCGLRDSSFDLVFTGQALHWFASEEFYAEVKRLLVPAGVFAAACYQRPHISDGIDAIIERLFNEILDGYWHPAVRHLQNGYADLTIPFRLLSAPSYKIETRWNMNDLFGFLNTWSAVVAYRNTTGSDPLRLIETEVHAHWGDPGHIRSVEWPVCLKLGKT